MDHGHKLFNFHEGYHVNNSIAPIIGSRKFDFFVKLVFLDVILRSSDKKSVKVENARRMHQIPIN